jgi:hypothetical protein
VAVNIGPKIGIDGEKEYRAALNNIIQQSKTLDSEMKALVSSFSAETSEEEKATKTAKIHAEQIDNQKKKVDMLQDMLNKSAAKYGENDTATLKWKQALNDATAELNDMEKEGKETTSQTKDMTKAVNKAADSDQTYTKDGKKATDQTDAMGKSFDKTGEKGLKFGDIIKANIIGDAVKKGFSMLVSAAKELGSAMVDAVKGAAEYADNMATLSIQTGIGTDKLQAYQYMANMTDTSLETITGSMSKLIKNMASAKDGTGAAADTFASMGISVTKADGTLRDSEDVFADLIEKMGQLPEGAERDALAMSVFGKSAQELNPLIAAGAEGINKWTAEAKNVGAVISTEDLAKLTSLQDLFDRIGATGEALKNRLGIVLADTILPQLEKFVDLLQGVAAGTVSFEEFGEEVGNILLELVNKISEGLPKVLDFAVVVITALVSGLMRALPKVASELPKIVFKLVEFMLSALPSILDMAFKIVVTLANGISAQLGNLIPAAVSTVMKIVQVLTSNLPLVWSAAMEIIKGLASGIISALPILLGELPYLVVQLVNTILDMIPVIIDCGTELLESLLSDENADLILTTWANALPDMILGLVNAIVNNAPKIAEAGYKMLSALVDRAPQLIEIYLNAFKMFWGKLIGNIIEQAPTWAAKGKELLESVFSKWKDIFSKVGSTLKTYGKQMIEGLWNGIKSAKDWLWNKVRSMLSSLTDKIKSFFGIHSPSKLFKNEIGENLALGIGVGFEDTMKSVTRDMAAAMPTRLGGNVAATGVNITVNGAPGQNVSELANIVAQKIQNQVSRRGAVYA